MPKNKNFALRVSILDELLNYRKWPREELFNRLNERLEQALQPSVSDKTFANDLKTLEEKMNAPLHRPTKSEPWFCYTEKFSLREIPFDPDELASLKQVVGILRQMPNLELHQDLEAMIRKLQGRIAEQEEGGGPIAYFDTETLILPQGLFENLCEAIRSQNVVTMLYQPYYRTEPAEKIVHPYFLKEFRKRWFLFGRVDGEDRHSIFALDRIRKLGNTKLRYVANDLIDAERYFNDVVGVSLSADAPRELVRLRVSKESAPYIRTKPIHRRQQEVERLPDGGGIFEMELIVNRELMSICLSYGPELEVLEPLWLRHEMKRLTQLMQGLYA